jgi:hypothetical protein
MANALLSTGTANIFFRDRRGEAVSVMRAWIDSPGRIAYNLIETC